MDRTTNYCIGGCWFTLAKKGEVQLVLLLLLFVGRNAKKTSVQGRKMKRCFIALHFCPICFGKCCPPFTYTSGYPLIASTN